MLGGGKGNRALESFNLLTHQWKTLPSPMMELLGYDTTVVDDKWIDVMGGYTNAKGQLATALAYNISTRTWKKFSPMIFKRNGCAVTAVDRRVYAFGGEVSCTAEMYDMGSQIWTKLPSMSTVRMGCSVVAVDRWILVIGGHGNNSYLDSVEIFDTQSQTWSAGAKTKIKRAYGAAALFGQPSLSSRRPELRWPIGYSRKDGAETGEC
mmetsp:Transcript_11779/g.27296  ORF Transcript_11779/g.27296 Transcript_11779/m.27296 type:complete len:208 (+) Transcript_11779:1029-1652(+)